MDLGLFGIVKENDFVLRILRDVNSESIYRSIFGTDRTGDQGRNIVALSCSFATGDTKQITFGPEWNFSGRYNHPGNRRGIAEIYFT